jgi:hypothetical protein
MPSDRIEGKIMTVQSLKFLSVVLATLTVRISTLPAATVTFTVSDVNDDAYAWGASAQNWTDDYVDCGNFPGDVAPYDIGAFRFAGVTIPKNATILHAYLRVQAYVTGSGSSSFIIAGEAYDSTNPFNYTPYIGQRSLTSAQIAWSVPSAWAEDGVYDSPDIKTVVQELVNRAGWLSGNALAIQLRNAASAGGYQRVYSIESAASWGASPTRLIIEYEGEAPPDGVKSQNFIPGATNTPSLVPTYLNNIMYWIDDPGTFAGLCWASCTADIFAYWDRNPYNGVMYWNLIDNGTAPLLEASLPTVPGHNQANVKATISYLAHEYYGLGHMDEKALIEKFANQTNGLAFTATYYGPVSATTDRTTVLGIIKGEIDAGRPTGIGSWGSYFGGPHQIPVIGYKEMSNTVNSTVYIHRNTGGTQSEFANFYASSWGNLDMDKIVPGGTPVDEYEARGDNTSVTTVSLNPDDVYGFRQTHNFSFAGDADWVRLSTVSGRQYTIETSSLGASCDTVLTLFQSDGITQVTQDDDGGSEARGSKIVWNCWTTGTFLIRVTDKVSGSGHAANYDLKVAYGAAVNHAPVITEGASVPVTMAEDGSPTAFNLTLNATDPDAGDILTWSILTPAGHGTATASGTGTAKAISYTPTVNWNGADSFVVRVSDGALTDDITVNVTIQPVNDPPNDVALSNLSVAENQPSGTAVGTLSTTDPDADNTFTYTLVSGAGSTDNASFAVSGNTLQTAATFNYEAKSSFSVRVCTTDQGDLSYEKPATVQVLDVDETPCFDGLQVLGGSNIVLRWVGVTNNEYAVRCSTNLLTGFSVVCSNIVATPPENTYMDSFFGDRHKFWQIILED